MKKLLVLSMVAFLISINNAWQPQTQSHMLYAHVKCLEHSNVSTLMLSTDDFWNVSDDDKTEASIRDYIHCSLSGLGFFNSKTGFNVDRIMQQIKEIPYLKNTSFQRSVIEKCADKNVNNDDAAVWAFRGFRCVMDEIKKEHEKIVLSK